MNLTPLILLLTACGSLIPPGPVAPDRYWLNPAPLEAAARPQHPAVKLDLRVVPGLDSDRVLMLAEDARLAPLEGAAWAEFLPEVLRSVIARSLSAGGYTIRADRALAGDCRLDLEVTGFFLAERGGRREAEVAFDGLFDCDGSALPVAVHATRPVTGEPAQAVAALQAALDDCMFSLQQAMRFP